MKICNRSSLLSVMVIICLLVFAWTSTNSVMMTTFSCAPTTYASINATSHSVVTNGVSSVYIRLLEEAEKRSNQDFAISHKRGERGVLIGPTEGNFERHTLRALQNARRIRTILAGDKSVKLALMTSPEHIVLLRLCNRTGSNAAGKEACRLWANGTLFDDVIATKEEYQGNDNHTKLAQGSSRYWLKALGGYRHAPYKTTLFLDSDAYPCPGFEKLFAIATPDDPSQKYWQMATQSSCDFAAGLDQYPFGTGNKMFWTPGDPDILKDFASFPERNTGTTLFHFHRELSHTFAHYIPLVAEHIYNNVATKAIPVVNDQCPFRVALYLMRRLRPDFVDSQIPQHSSCRSYPGLRQAGTDGFKNGMFPMQPDGKPCSECYCTPCLITHTAGIHAVKINGKMGWEDDLL